MLHLLNEKPVCIALRRVWLVAMACYCGAVGQLGER